MKKILHAIPVFILLLNAPLLAQAQHTAKIAPISCDTLAFDTLRVPRLTYIYDEKNPYYDIIDTLQCPHIVEELYSNGNVRLRFFIRATRSLSSHIFYMEDGKLLNFTFGAYYKGTQWWFTDNDYSLMFQGYPEKWGGLLAEFTKREEKYRVRKGEIEMRTKRLKYWKLCPRHGEPVKYARKLLRIYKAQYKDVFYHLDNCIWY